jgi:hypothetical protein
MQHDRKDQLTNLPPDPNHPNLLTRWGRQLVILGAGLFGISLTFPLLASTLTPALFPQWFGVLDVAFAFAFMLTMALINAASGGQITQHTVHLSYRIYRGAASLLLVLLVIFFVAGDRIGWSILLPGLAWRMWLLVYFLPAWLTVWERHKATGKPDVPAQRPADD